MAGGTAGPARARELRRLPEVVWGRRGVELGGAAFLFALPLVATEGQLNLLGVVILFAIVGISLVVLTGWAGQVSLGQVACFGIGAGVAGYLSSTRGWDLVAACLAAAECMPARGCGGHAYRELRRSLRIGRCHSLNTNR